LERHEAWGLLYMTSENKKGKEKRRRRKKIEEANVSW
jgi:hypothetical protein